MSALESSSLRTTFIKRGCAEWASPTRVLMCSPDAFGRIPEQAAMAPAAFLFEGAFATSSQAQRNADHVNLAQTIAAHTGVAPVLLDDTLLQQRRLLESLAMQATQPHLDHLSSTQQASVQSSYQVAVKQATPEQLLTYIMKGERYTFLPDSKNTGVVASTMVETNPLSNLLFMRDSSITTPMGVVLANLNSPQRAREPEVVAGLYQALNIPVLARIQEPGKLEGGDYIPAGVHGFIGQGLRTNAAGIQQLFNAGAFGGLCEQGTIRDVSIQGGEEATATCEPTTVFQGHQRVVVVHDRFQNQDQMHLDTYFNILDHNLCVMVDTRVAAANKPENIMHTTCDVYQFDSTLQRYEKMSEGIDFVSYLRQQGFTIISVSNDNQLKYGINFLTIGPRACIFVKRDDGIDATYRAALAEHNVTLREVNLSALTTMYGAAHCGTQVTREPRYPVTCSVQSIETQTES